MRPPSPDNELESAIKQAAQWAEEFIRDYTDFQIKALPQPGRFENAKRHKSWMPVIRQTVDW